MSLRQLIHPPTHLIISFHLSRGRTTKKKEAKEHTEKGEKEIYEHTHTTHTHTHTHTHTPTQPMSQMREKRVRSLQSAAAAAPHLNSVGEDCTETKTEESDGLARAVPVLRLQPEEQKRGPCSHTPPQ
mmetsp:Transcript_27568/g.54099  ORF Transcript_27568/g.54099 Transcript_27568/m.54099 type:complete len:128 (+) Transcript_27568:344-727(+)